MELSVLREHINEYLALIPAGVMLTAFAGWLLFGESMTLLRRAGIRVICCGVWLITQTA